MSRLLLFLGAIILSIALPAAHAAEAVQLPADAWYGRDAQGEVRVKLYFFWSRHCPHCTEARPVVEAMAGEHSWIDLHSHEVTTSAEGRELYTTMAGWFRQEPRSVPGFFFCGNMMVGYDGEETTGRFLHDRLVECRLLVGGTAATKAERVVLPGVGEVDRENWSLPALTVAIAGLDAFNPCAFFVLLFLLSLMAHARNRGRMLLIGGTFVFFSGLVYFLFMAAWLNLFLWIGELRVVTVVAALLAITAALLNIKEGIRPGSGPSLSIPEGAKPGLYQRMRGLLKAESIGAMMVGTVLLALIANSYELLCTSGLPMVYTRVLTLEGLPQTTYYLYLLLYNVVYVVPLLAIVIAITWSLGAHKLQAAEGESLKLLSGLMMLGLGVVLLVDPAWLANLLVAGGLILAALLVTGAVHFIRLRGRGIGGGTPI